LERKISAKLGAMIAWNPRSSSAQAACSRELPQPKFAPATRMAAPPKRGSFSTNDGSSHHAENSPTPYPVRSTRFSQSLGMI